MVSEVDTAGTGSVDFTAFMTMMSKKMRKARIFPLLIQLDLTKFGCHRLTAKRLFAMPSRFGIPRELAASTSMIYTRT